VLALSPLDRQQFGQLIAEARAAKPLEFADLFTREQLEPV